MIFLCVTHCNEQPSTCGPVISLQHRNGFILLDGTPCDHATRSTWKPLRDEILGDIEAVIDMEHRSALSGKE